MKKRIIISGGGTGGHIFPAISIANAIKKHYPETEILFVGAEGKMEMEKVPQAGYPIKGLPVAGLQRKLSLSNLALPFKVLKSLKQARRILKDFHPDAAVGVGGYASAPLLWCASRKKIPTLIQEQNSFAGLTNKILSKRVRRICVAYDHMERFFPREKIVFTGNPIRSDIRPYTAAEKADACNFFQLDPSLPTVVVVGGSLGCGTFNRIMRKWTEEKGRDAGYQVIWQSGKYYRSQIDSWFQSLGGQQQDGWRRYGRMMNGDFITDMTRAFAIADVIVSRAGAGTISELCAAGKAAIFVPSPNVAEDHQTHNAMALVEKEAALMVSDAEADRLLIPALEGLLADRKKIGVLEKNILTLARPDAAEVIAKEIMSL